MMQRLSDIIRNLLPLKAAFFAVLMGSASFLVLFLGFQFNLPGTSASTDPREVLNAIGAAFSGPAGAVIIALISSFGEPSANHKIYIAFQHIISAVWIGWAYRQLIYKKQKIGSALLAWIAAMFVYYFVAYIPASAFLNYYYKDLWLSFTGGHYTYFEGLLFLYKGWMPEFLFTSGFTALLIIALPDKYRMPLWGSSAGMKSFNLSGMTAFSMNRKITSGSLLGIRLTVWFIILSSIPVILISIYIKNVFTEYSIQQSAGMQQEYVRQIRKEIDTLNNGDIYKYLNSLRRYPGFNFHYCTGKDGKTLSSLNIGGPAVLSDEQIHKIFSQKEGTVVIKPALYAGAYIYIEKYNLYIISFSEKIQMTPMSSELIGSINQNLILILITVSVLAGIIVWLIIGLPVKKMTRAVNEISGPKSEMILDTFEMTDEIRILAGAFNEMKIRIKNAYEKLEIEMNQKLNLQQEIIEANNLLKEREEKFRLLFETANDGILLVREGRYFDCNPKAEELFLLPKSKIIGRHPSSLSPGILPNGWSSKDFAEQKIQAALKGTPQFFEWTHLRSDGTSFDAQISLNRLEVNGELILQAVLRDVTEQKRTAKKLSRNLIELESKNAELERFTYTVSHDLKSPLITIKGFIGLLRSDIEKQKWESTLTDIERISGAADKMQALLEDLLELSRIGRIINPNTEFSMSVTASEALSITQDPELPLDAEIIINPDMPSVSGDKIRIREVYQNLIENAIKYRKKDQKLLLEIGYLKKDKTDIYFVRDNGIGINSAYTEKIFGLFEKLDPKSKGSGIGLAIVKRIIELHGGRIWVESDGSDMGSSFYFTIKPPEEK